MIQLKTEHNQAFRCIKVDGGPMGYSDFTIEAYALRNAFKDSELRSKILLVDKSLMLYYEHDEVKACIDLIRKVSSESNASTRSDSCNRSREETWSPGNPEAIGGRMAGGESGSKRDI